MKSWAHKVMPAEKAPETKQWEGNSWLLNGAKRKGMIDWLLEPSLIDLGGIVQ